MNRGCRIRAICLSATLIAAALVSPSRASAAGDADAAKGIVVQHCVACHEVPGYPSKAGAAQLGAPSFAAIANNPQSYDPKELQTWLRRPHWPMHQFMLSDRDIDNLLAFIASLRKN